MSEWLKKVDARTNTRVKRDWGEQEEKKKNDGGL